MDIIVVNNKIIVLTLEDRQANLFRLETLKHKVTITDAIIDYNKLPLVRLTLTFPDNESQSIFTRNFFDKILYKVMIQSNIDFLIVDYVNSHLYAFSKRLKWGKEFPQKTIITSKMLEKEKQEFDRRKWIDKRIKRMNKQNIKI